MKSSQFKFASVQQFGVHIAKNGTVYTIFTGYGHKHTLCAFCEPLIQLVDPEFVHINAIMHQALDDRNARNYFATCETPKTYSV